MICLTAKKKETILIECKPHICGTIQFNVLIDDITIKVRAGHGGKGAVAFQRIKLAQGPTGSAGGRGGSVYLEAVPDIGALHKFRSAKEFKAENGMNGRTKLVDGKSGDDLTLLVPVGTVVHKQGSHDVSELTKPGERLLIAKGGLGGKGNYYFRSSVNTSPQEYQPGLPGESFVVRLELKMIADVGIVGLPNAGKTTLLNALTRSGSKVASYPFTTLEPNLGEYYSLILADIPGLIEGASVGKGLGTKFLRHIERTRVLFHLISVESDDVVRDYNVIRQEMTHHNPALGEKEEKIFLTKIDMATPEEVEKKIGELRAIGKDAVGVNFDDMDPVKRALEKIKASITTNPA
jgi:GTPase